VAAEAPEAPVSARAKELRRERRRREPGDIDVMVRQKLSIPPDIQEQLDRNGMTARFALDSGQGPSSGRIQQLIQDEWDIVPGVDQVPASRTDASKHVLMAKRKDWYDDDRKHLSDLNKSNEKRAIKGDIGDGEVSTEGFYETKGTRNQISRGA
jgi:hypothetical protein